MSGEGEKIAQIFRRTPNTARPGCQTESVEWWKVHGFLVRRAARRSKPHRIAIDE
jgi:hypothetical protein